MVQVVILGAGAIGSYVGACLGKNRSNDVVLIGKKRHVDLVRKQGLHIRYTDSRTEIVHPTIKEKIQHLDPNAIILLTCKATDIASCLEPISPLLRDDTLIVPIQNGIGIKHQVEQALNGRGRILRALCFIGATFLQPGSVEHTGGDTIMVDKQAGVERLEAAFAGSDLILKESTNIRKQVLFKAILNSVINPLSAIHRCPVGKLREPQFTPIVKKAIHELAQVAECEGVHFDEVELKKAMDNAFNMIATSYSSMYQDLLKHHPSEIEFINGAWLKMGRKHHVNMPCNQALYDSVKTIENNDL